MAFAPVFGRAFPAAFDRHQPAAVATGITNWITTHYTGTRNDFDGSVGYELLIGASDITIVALGRSVSDSIAQTHKVKVYDNVYTVVAEVDITESSPVLDGYAYEMLGTPVTLTAGGTYTIASREHLWGDLWKDLFDLTDHAATATVIIAKYGQGDYWPSATWGDDGGAFVPSTFFT